MTKRHSGWTKTLSVVFVAGLFGASAVAGERRTLVSAVADDVFLCVSGRHNAERAVLPEYWSEVLDALKQSGVGTDSMAMLESYCGEKQQAEVDRLKTKILRLIEGVDWEALGGGELLFAERMNAPIRVGDGLSIGPPEMVWLIRGAPDSASKNSDGLVAILETIAAEINYVAGEETLAVDRTALDGAKAARMHLLAAVPQAPPMSWAVTQKGDVITITLGDRIRGEVLELLGGNGSKKSLADSVRFKKAFARLPRAVDEMTFFDVQALLKTFRTLAYAALAAATQEGEDEVLNAYMNDKANKLASKGLDTFGRADYKQALQFTKEAHEVAPTDSRIMYNLACFHAMAGNKNTALEWLHKAVAGGFHSPIESRRTAI